MHAKGAHSDAKGAHLLLGDVEDDGRGLEEADGGAEGMGPSVNIKGARSDEVCTPNGPMVIRDAQ